jgi:DNA-directed RNA polymerase specialized sigma24 family protein
MKPPNCEWERQTLAAIRGSKAKPGVAGKVTKRVAKEVAKHAQACQICSEILLVNAFLRRLKQHDWQLLWLAYVKGLTHEQAALAMNLRAETIRRRLSLTRSKLAALIRVRFRPSQEVSE